MPRLLLVEDEPDIALALRMDLEAEGYEVLHLADGLLASQQGRDPSFDLILLDVMLPRRDGFDVLRDLRRAGVSTPILLLTARSHEAEKVLGLEAGADDYVTKPFSARELRARIKALLRRGQSPSSAPSSFSFGLCTLDLDRAELLRSGQPVDLTALEFRLLAFFVQHRGRILPRERLITEIWGSDVHVTDRVVDTHIMKLRRKIEPDAAEPRYLINVRGLGYRFDA